jgi:Protein of unknown function (DUF1573)
MRYGQISLILLLWLFPAIVMGATGPKIALDRNEHDFGDVQVGDVVRTHIRVSNKGDAALVIEEVRTSCGCTTAAGHAREVAPGQETDIAVSFDSVGLSQGRKTQTVFIHTNDAKSPVSRFRIFANVVHPISIEPANLIAKLSHFQERTSFPVTATNNSPQPVTLVVSAVEGGISKAALQPEKIVVQAKSETRFQIEMDLKKPDKGNVVTGAVSVSTDQPKIRHIRVRCLIRFDELK